MGFRVLNSGGPGGGYAHGYSSYVTVTVVVTISALLGQHFYEVQGVLGSPALPSLFLYFLLS